MDTQQDQNRSMIEAAMLGGPRRNYSPLTVQYYYNLLASTNEKMLSQPGSDQIYEMALHLIECVNDMEKYVELKGMYETLYKQYVTNVMEKANAKKLSDLPNEKDVLIAAHKEAFSRVRMEVAIIMGEMHSLKKLRGVGCAFMFSGDGDYIFPLDLIPPDGVYIRTETATAHDLKMHEVLEMWDKKDKPGTDEDDPPAWSTE
jgi:hypothetical protein